MIKKAVQKHGLTFLKYSLVGVSGTLIDIAVFTIVVSTTPLGHDWAGRTAAATLGFLLAVVNNYTWNRIWTFKSHKREMGKQFFSFFVVSCGGWLLNVLFVMLFSWLLFTLLQLHVLADLPAWANAIAKGSASAVVLIYNFVGNRFWTFKERK